MSSDTSTVGISDSVFCWSEPKRSFSSPGSSFFGCSLKARSESRSMSSMATSSGSGSGSGSGVLSSNSLKSKSPKSIPPSDGKRSDMSGTDSCFGAVFCFSSLFSSSSPSMKSEKSFASRSLSFAAASAWACSSSESIGSPSRNSSESSISCTFFGILTKTGFSPRAARIFASSPRVIISELNCCSCLSPGMGELYSSNKHGFKIISALNKCEFRFLCLLKTNWKKM